MAEDILRVEGLSTSYFTRDGQVNAVSNLDMRIERGDVFGIVGESGSGKSVTARSLMDLIESPGEITDGEIRYRDSELVEALADDYPGAIDDEGFVDLLSVPESVRRSLRGSAFSMIFQDPESSFNPSLTVGEQLAEAIEVQRRASARPRSTRARTEPVEYSFGSYLTSLLLPGRDFTTRTSHERAVELLEQVGIPDPAQRANEYPHEYSGGMLQRAMIAQALAGEPDVLIADEPTTALDVTIQAQVLELLRNLQADTGMTILLITHDLGVIARMCDRVGVMYAGEIVERGTLEDVFDRPVHPYTQGLLGSIPDLERVGGRLDPIPGNVPSLLDHEMEDRCYFADRCPAAMEACLDKPPDYDVEGNPNHEAACHLAVMDYDEGQALPEDFFEGQADAVETDTSAEPLDTGGDGAKTDGDGTDRGGDAVETETDGGEP